MFNETLQKYSFLKDLGIEEVNSGACSGVDTWLPTEGRDLLESISPIDGSVIAKVALATSEDYENVIKAAQEEFQTWQMIPAPKRGLIIRDFGDELRKYKDALGQLITLEMGKIVAEGKGEVQEAIDISDFAVGLSRQLYGLTMKSERVKHRMFEQYHPLGVVGIITSFNFPVAVWSWNSMIAAVTGDTMVWKPSSQTPLCAIAVQKIANRVMKRHGLKSVFTLVIGRGSEVGEKLLNDRRVPLISATGSTRMGVRVAEVVGKRLGRTILELGGNNAIILMEDANLDLAIRAILFGAVGTAGQRCTTTRRIIVQRSILKEVEERLIKAYKQVTIGDPLDPHTVMGPVVSQQAIKDMLDAINALPPQGGKLIHGGERVNRKGFYITPAIAEAPGNIQMVCTETFAPLLYIIPFDTIDEAIELHNGVPQGLSSAIFTDSVKYSERFLSTIGSDCGIANVNIGTSGAEIGGAFGGHKDTGNGGVEAGSDAWKQYMKRQTSTINWSDELPLAQGIKFGE